MVCSLITGTLICRLRGLTVVATPEELVRQQVIDQLLAWGYPWHTWTCELAHPRWGAAAGRADLLFNARDQRADAIIEVKAYPPRPIDLEQVRRYAQQWGSQVVAATDGESWLVEQRMTGEWSAIDRFPGFGDWIAAG